jgi:hypothetical protein
MNKGDFSSDFAFFVSLGTVSFKSWPRAQWFPVPLVKMPGPLAKLADTNKIVARRVGDHPETA